MSLHPVLDAADQRRALDAAPFEELVGALVRRSARRLALAEAAYHELSRETVTPGRLRELALVCVDSARVTRNVADAVLAMAPGSELDRLASGYARAAATFDRLADMRVQLFRGHLVVNGVVSDA